MKAWHEMSARPSVFLADDDPGVRDQIESWQRTTGAAFQVRAFATGRQLLRRVSYELPDLILLDLTLAGMDGLTALRLLKNEPAPIVMLSPDTLEAARATVEALLGGAADYILKKRRNGAERLCLTPEDFLERLQMLAVRGARGSRARAGDARRIFPSSGAALAPADSPDPRGTWLAPHPADRDADWRWRPARDAFPEQRRWVGVALATPRSIGLLTSAFAAAPPRPAGAMVIVIDQAPHFARAVRELLARCWGRPVLEMEASEALRAGQWRLVPSRRLARPRGEDHWELCAHRPVHPQATWRRQLSLLAPIASDGLRIYLCDEPTAELREPLQDLRARGAAVLMHARASALGCAPGGTPASDARDGTDALEVRVMPASRAGERGRR